MANPLVSFAALFLFYIFQQSNASYNVITFGAKPDGKTDSTQPFLKAWSAACSSASPSIIYVPKGRYLLKETVFRGPCKNKITVQIDGSLVAPTDYLNRVSVFGGTLDAKALLMACRKSGLNCPVGARSMTFNWANDILISGLTSINSQSMHLVINGCNNVLVRNVRAIAPDLSPNTDGIHVQVSTGVTITQQLNRLHINRPKYQEHANEQHQSYSIGSLGKDVNEGGVENITLTNSIFSGSDNGVRIKSWARPSNGFVRNVVYQNLIMNNVRNPIIIDQNYCPNNQGCPRQSSGVKISQVTFRNIKGTSATPEAVKFDCSSSNPCSGIRLQDIKLTYMNKAATSSCKNIGGTSSGVIMPQSCV
uniref:Pectate lyase superfamily protein domain-containing protein n=1 Tax=Salix viminalis TaxID=40686 RepID=A0A6N2K7P4_SALVM